MRRVELCGQAIDLRLEIADAVFVFYNLQLHPVVLLVSFLSAALGALHVSAAALQVALFLGELVVLGHVMRPVRGGMAG